MKTKRKVELFNNIPKKIHFYWGFNSNMSFLNLLTLVSFRKHNPDWEMILHRPKISSKYVLSQYINDYKSEYISKDYTPYLTEIKDLQIREFDFDTIGIEIDCAEVFKSDILRWYLLSTEGGGWADMDILFVKSLNSINSRKRMIIGDEKNPDTVIVFKDFGYHPIGFYLSKQNNPFFQEIYDNCISNFNNKEYQSVGRLLLDKLFPSYKVIISKHPKNSILDLQKNVVYPFSFRQLKFIFYANIKYLIKNSTIGIHWYNGGKIAKEFNNTYNIHKGKTVKGFWRLLSLFRKNATIQDYMEEYLYLYKG